MKTYTKETQAATTPEMALQYLREGNERFVGDLREVSNLLEDIKATGDGQYPVVVILSCIDSRIPAEIVFDQGIGYMFSVRIAGNIVNEDILGSMEFACKVAGAKLIVVLGHSKCGAIKGACDSVQMGNLSTLLNKIQPAVYRERTVTENRNSKNDEFVQKVADIQVKHSLEEVVENSVVLREMIEKSEVGLIGAMYDVKTGKVKFLDDTLMLGEIKDFD